MEAKAFLGLLETRRQLLAMLQDRRAGKDARTEGHHLQLERSRLAIAHSRVLLSRPVITMKDTERQPH